MQSATVSLVLLTSVIVSGYHSSGVKLRRDGVLNLYPFPRVGRSSARPWPPGQLRDLYSANVDYEQTNKRQLYAFPRVGRSGLPIGGLMEDRGEGTGDMVHNGDSGMWFGPRLGRGIKSEDDSIDRSIDGSDPELLEPESNANGLKRTADRN